MNEKNSLSQPEPVVTGANAAPAKPSPGWEICVVCGHGVEPGHHGARINHLGNTVNLCGPNCLRAFASDPAPYLGRLARALRERAWRMETEAA